VTSGYEIIVVICIDVINVSKKIKKALINAFLSKKRKRTFANVIKNVTLFLLPFDAGPID